MSTKDTFLLGLDIGASSIKYGFGDCQRGLQFFSKQELAQRSLACLQGTVQDILAHCESLTGSGSIRAIGIGTPGTIDRASMLLAGVNPNLPFWVGHDPRQLVPAHLGIPVASDNDANLMALGEAWLRGSEGLTVGITVGSGIGCGLVNGGRLYHGAHGWAMELGHIISVQQGVPCTCGRNGCLEAYTSVDGIRRRIIGELGDICSPKDGLLGILATRESFPRVGEIIQEGMTILARGIANLIVLLDPDRVVLGGGAMDGNLYPPEQLFAAIRSLLPEINRSATALEGAREGNRAGVLGAIVLADQTFPQESE